MSFLKQIPVEDLLGSKEAARGRGKSAFNPAPQIKKHNVPAKHSLSLKEVCMELVHFINRGERFTIDQIEKVISLLQRSVMVLQKKKMDLMRSDIMKGKQDKKNKKNNSK